MRQKEPPSLQGAEAALAQVRQEVRDLARRWDGRAGDDVPSEAVGEAADGLIRVVAVNGRLERVRLDPAVVRMPSADLAEEFRRAANAALAGAETAYTLAVPGVDFAALAGQLAEVETMGARALRQCRDSIDAAVAAYRDRGRL